MNRAEAEQRKNAFRHAYACRAYKPYVWDCILVEEPETHEWIIEVYLKKDFPNKKCEPLAPLGMKLRFIPPIA